VNTCEQKENWICEKKIPQEQVYYDNVQKFQIEYRMQLRSTVIISKTRQSLLFRWWRLTWT